MSSYFDPNAEAQMLGQQIGQMEGERLGRKAGFQAGRRAGFDAGQQGGYDLGYSDGKNHGYTGGWNAAIDVANLEMVKQKEITAKHVSEKQHLAIEAQALRELIGQLHTRLNELDARASDLGSKQLEAAWQLNRCAVFMNLTRAVLEDLTAVDSAQAGHVRELFATRYTEHVEAALKKGAILTPLDADDVLTQTMPRTQQFIRYMLASALALSGPLIWSNTLTYAARSSGHSPAKKVTVRLLAGLTLSV